MQEGSSNEVARLRDPDEFEEGWTTGRNDGLMHEKRRFSLWPLVGAKMDSCVYVSQTEIEGVEPRLEIDGNARVCSMKRWQPWREPSDTEGWQYREIKRSALRIGAKSERRCRYSLQCLANLDRKNLAGICQPDLLSVPMKQLRAKRVFKRTDLATYRALCQI